MKTLNSVSWGEISFEDLFDIKPGVRLTKSEMIEGKRPFIGATDSNNGITAFCGNTNKSLDSNCLGVNYNGSVVENFYHPYEAIFSDDVKHMHLKGHKGNKYIYLFLKNLILKQKDKFQYGYKFNGDRMTKQVLLVPIDNDGSPDFNFMEQYMRRIEKKLLLRYKQYLQQKRYNLLDNCSIESENITKPEGWKDFQFSEIFSLKATKSSIDKKNLSGLAGQIPYITRTDRNNGIDSFVGIQPNFRADEPEVITIGLDTQTVFFQRYMFYTGQNIHVLTNENINLYVACYIIPLIKIQLQKFNWGGNGATLGRLKKLKLMLPTNSEGNPDFEYMEQYMRTAENQLLERYINFRLKYI